MIGVARGETFCGYSPPQRSGAWRMKPDNLICMANRIDDPFEAMPDPDAALRPLVGEAIRRDRELLLP